MAHSKINFVMNPQPQMPVQTSCDLYEKTSYMTGVIPPSCTDMISCRVSTQWNVLPNKSYGAC